MRNNIIIYSVYCSCVLALLFVAGGCSKLNENIATNPNSLGLHKAGIIDVSSPDFHGTLLKTGSWKYLDCQQCHGANLAGGPKAPSCRSCHKNAGGHKTGIVDPSSADFHGTLISAGTWTFSQCKTCHGADLKGGANAPSCTTCHESVGGHESGVSDPNSPNFHGKLIEAGVWKLVDCRSCHGIDLKGTNDAPSCYSCHADAGGHAAGITDPNSPDFHGKLIKANSWKTNNCQNCHGSNFAGGPNGPTCNSCHTNPGGPTACNTCHGSFADPGRIAPPRDIDGNTSTTAIGVGAHWNHLYDNKLGKKVSCETCHIVPTSYSGHNINGTAEVNLTGLAVLNGANAQFNLAAGTCSGTYCHGNFEFKKSDAAPENQYAFTADKMVGNNVTVKWNKVDGSEVFCGSCHGLPPVGHIQVPVNQCVACHSTVVDENGKIIDINKHINGVINIALNKK